MGPMFACYARVVVIVSDLVESMTSAGSMPPVMSCQSFCMFEGHEAAGVHEEGHGGGIWFTTADWNDSCSLREKC